MWRFKDNKPYQRIKEVLEWLYNTLYQKFISNFHAILKLCFWWQCYKPLQDYKQMFVCLFVSRTLWVLVRRLWQSYSSLLRLPKYQHNKLTICVVLQTNQVLCLLAHSICRNTSITDCDLTLERLQLETKMIHTNATK